MLSGPLTPGEGHDYVRRTKRESRPMPSAQHHGPQGLVCETGSPRKRGDRTRLPFSFALNPRPATGRTDARRAEPLPDATKEAVMTTSLSAALRMHRASVAAPAPLAPGA